MFRFVKLLALAILLAGFAGSLLSQTTTGRITGTVTDASGAVIPGVEVVVRNPATGLTRNVVTNESGTYQVPLLPPSLYEVEAALPGFRREVRSGITVAVEAVVRVDFTLRVGELQDEIKVTADAPLVQSDTATLGQVMDSRKVTDIPLNARHFMRLTVLTTGVLPDVEGGDRQSPSFYANGVARNKNNFLLDGVDNNDTGNSQLVIIPSIDAIQEFKLSTSTYGAELGRASGGVLNVQTKGGSNDFHGVFFEFLRNDALDARNFFAPNKQPFKRNQFGTVISGPVMKDKWFYMFNYEGNRIRRTDTKLGRVPGLRERAGDFSELGRQLIDPLTRQPFPGNILSANRINTIARNIATFYPEPNRVLSSGSNYVANAKGITDFDLVTGRVDYRISDKQNIFGRFTWQDTYEVQTNFDGPATLPRSGNTFFQPIGRNAAISDTFVIGPREVNEFRVGFNRLIGGIYDETYGRDYAKDLGVTGVQSSFHPDPRRFGWPRASVTGYSRIGTTGFSAQLRFDNTWHWYDMLAVTRGNHQMKIGGEVRTYMLNIFIDGNPNGSFAFDGRYSGNAYADMLLGYPSQTSRRVGSPYTQNRSRAVSAFFQDDWKVTPTFTFNLGVRWEMQTRSINVLKGNDRGLAVFDVPTRQILISGRSGPQTFQHPIYPDQTITLNGANEHGIPEGLYHNDLNNYAPRFGFAWSPTEVNLVVRGGYGIFFEPEISAKHHGNRDGAYPWNIPQTFNANATTPNITMYDPFPDALAQSSITATAVDPYQRDGYMQQWNLSLQRQLGRDMVLELAYVGTKGTKLVSSRDINQPRLGAGSINSRRPIQGWGNISQTERADRSNYHSMQAKLERRFSAGLTFVSAWTWSHSIECCSGAQDPDDLRNGQQQSSFDIRHRQVNSFSYELPVGSKKRFLSGISGVASALLGGWQVAGIATFSTGQSFTPAVSGDIAQVGSSSTRPNRRGDGVLPRGQRNAARWFDTSAFAVGPTGAYGNSGGNILKAPGLNNWDFTLMKNTPIGEDHRLEFRTEFFNAFNHGQFFLPNSTVNSPQFGAIERARDARQIQFGLKFYY